MEVLPIEKRFWIEIDFEEDYEKAREEISTELVRLAEREFGKV
jgi:choline kinase